MAKDSFRNLCAGYPANDAGGEPGPYAPRPDRMGLFS